MIHIELSPKATERLAEAARVRGLQPEMFAAQIIETADFGPQTKAADAEAFLAGMLAFSDKTPVLPEQTLTRESFYRDHD